MRLYLVTDRRTADKLRAGGPMRYADSLMIDDDHGDHGGTIRVPCLVFYHFPWLDDLTEELPTRPDYEQLAIEVPDEVAARYERRDPEGGNSTWYIPPSHALRVIAERGGIAPPAPDARPGGPPTAGG